MEAVISPYILMACLGVGAVGVSLALPRPRVSPQAIGAILAGVAMGGLLLALGAKAGSERPGLYFYVFSLLGLGSALRVISHSRPVYAALYFIVTILASSALYLMLRAEFLAFALIIIYAGAILITYLFVIMLAEQSPSEHELGTVSEYDRFSREPMAATVVGFVLLAALTGMMARGVSGGELESEGALLGEVGGGDGVLIGKMPRKAIRSLERAGVFAGLEKPGVSEVASLLDGDGRGITLRVRDKGLFARSLEWKPVAALFAGSGELEAARAAVVGDRVRVGLPADIRDENLEGVGFALIAEHPMALELAGVILLMAMLGAVVLARKQIEISEGEKAERALGMGESVAPL